MSQISRLILILLLWTTLSVQAAQFGTDRFVEYRPGGLPIVLTSPHGGSLTPDPIPDRQEGVTSKDMSSPDDARDGPAR